MLLLRISKALIMSPLQQVLCGLVMQGVHAQAANVKRTGDPAAAGWPASYQNSRARAPGPREAVNPFCTLTQRHVQRRPTWRG